MLRGKTWWPGMIQSKVGHSAHHSPAGPGLTTIWFDSVEEKYLSILIGWWTVVVNIGDCDWTVDSLTGLRGVLGLMYRQVGPEQWKNNCSIYKGPFNRRGSSASLTGTQTVGPSLCYQELVPSQDHIRTHNYLLPLLHMLSCCKSEFKKLGQD